MQARRHGQLPKKPKPNPPLRASRMVSRASRKRPKRAVVQPRQQRRARPHPKQAKPPRRLSRLSRQTEQAEQEVCKEIIIHSVSANEALLVLTNLPDEASADLLAAHLVEHRLAACVNRLAPCHSVCRWQGAVETATEIPLLIKTTRERYAAVEAAVLELHPYDVPELIAVAIEAGLPAYLRWVQEETSPE